MQDIRPPSRPELDDIDIRLLTVIEADAAVTNQQIAERIHLSASQVSRRRQRLEDEGIIRGIRAELSATRLGLDLVVFIQVTLATHARDTDRQFADLVTRMPQVQEAYMLTGNADYMLKVLARDLSHLQSLIADVLLPHPAIARVSSSIALNRLKEGGSILAASRA